jgi:protein-S-isoprenylcysteine O-methyltransferase Ste14
MSIYMLIAIRHEERDLVCQFGKDYEDYRQRVGMLAPRFRRIS